MSRDISAATKDGDISDFSEDFSDIYERSPHTFEGMGQNVIFLEDYIDAWQSIGSVAASVVRELRGGSPTPAGGAALREELPPSGGVTQTVADWTTMDETPLIRIRGPAP